MSVIQIGLVDTTGEIAVEFVHAVAMALNLQVTRDLLQFWPVSATVIVSSRPKQDSVRCLACPTCQDASAG